NRITLQGWRWVWIEHFRLARVESLITLRSVGGNLTHAVVCAKTRLKPGLCSQLAHPPPPSAPAHTTPIDHYLSRPLRSFDRASSQSACDNGGNLAMSAEGRFRRSRQRTTSTTAATSPRLAMKTGPR